MTLTLSNHLAADSAYHALRRDVLVGLARRLPRPSPLDFGPGRPPVRVLYLRYDRIGDMILSTGLLRAIARRQLS